jgi:hypothetical protein
MIESFKTCLPELPPVGQAIPKAGIFHYLLAQKPTPVCHKRRFGSAVHSKF